QQPIAGEVAVEVVDALEMVEVEQKQCAAKVAGERILAAAQQVAAIGEAGRRIGVGVALGGALGLLIGIERLLEVLRTPPTEQDDRDVEQERDLQRVRGIRQRSAGERRRHDLAAQADEQQQRGNRRAAGDEMAARNANSVSACSLHLRILFLNWINLHLAAKR